jgi:hypothetical protein
MKVVTQLTRTVDAANNRIVLILAEVNPADLVTVLFLSCMTVRSIQNSSCQFGREWIHCEDNLDLILTIFLLGHPQARPLPKPQNFLQKLTTVVALTPQHKSIVLLNVLAFIDGATGGKCLSNSSTFLEFLFVYIILELCALSPKSTRTAYC